MPIRISGSKAQAPIGAAVVKGGAKVRRVAGRSKSAAPQRGLAENGGCTAASVAAGADIGQEALECTATWINGLQFGAVFWFRG